MEVLLTPFSWCVGAPYLALIPAFLLGGCYFGLRGRSAPRSCSFFGVAAILWCLYSLYEGWMFFSGNSVKYNIRLDLLLIAVILYFVSFASVIIYFTSRHRA